MEKVILVPQYETEDLGFLAVQFYPNDLVEVLVTNKAETYPGYTYPRPSKDYAMNSVTSELFPTSGLRTFTRKEMLQDANSAHDT
ncbi:hypothetical protein GCM10011572_31520 [Pseudoduganella buxea]|uniref:Uncharacterized protein n=1 Tax=Pseudoduganella buxea TaxID=1949069 RepID=A0ABQ1KQG2_9BURK|nr:hypothetical protein GCM10011572_31520 [Pseudoduganella buxea]